MQCVRHARHRKQLATCYMPCVRNCYFPHTGDVSTEHFRSSLVSNVIKAVTAFLTVYCLARGTIANATKRLLRKIESREMLANCWYVNTLIARFGVSPRVPSLGSSSLCRQWWDDRNPYKVLPTALALE